MWRTAGRAGRPVCSRGSPSCGGGGRIMNGAADPDRRRRGVATALIGRLLERVGDDSAQYTLEVRCSNEGAIELYERFGFRSAGLRRRYYQDNGEDAVIMWRTQATLNGSLEDVPGAARTVPS